MHGHATSASCSHQRYGRPRMHCSRVFADFGVIILLRLLALFACIIIGGDNNPTRNQCQGSFCRASLWAEVSPSTMPQHSVCNFIFLGKKTETFTQQLLQCAVAIAALHLILELLTKVLSHFSQLLLAAEHSPHLFAATCDCCPAALSCSRSLCASLCPFTMAVRRGMTVSRVSVLDIASSPRHLLEALPKGVRTGGCFLCTCISQP